MMTQFDVLRGELQQLRADHPWRPGLPPLAADVVAAERALLDQLAALGWTREREAKDQARRRAEQRQAQTVARRAAWLTEHVVVRPPIFGDVVYTVAEVAIARRVAEKIAAGERPDPVGGRCPNCDDERGDDLGPLALFCGELCSQIAQLVRWLRRKIAAGELTVVRVADELPPDLTWQDPLDETSGYWPRLGCVLGGGYPKAARQVPAAVREAVMERDGQRCVACGATDELTIDHITDSSPDPANLQVMCRGCNVAKAEAGGKPALLPEHHAAELALWRRVLAPTPGRPCDDPGVWPGLWRSLRPARSGQPRPPGTTAAGRRAARDAR